MAHGVLLLMLACRAPECGTNSHAGSSALQADSGGDDSDGADGARDHGPFVAVAAGGGTACALHADGAVACWGDCSTLQCNVPRVPFTQIRLEASFGCGLVRDDEIVCWGGDHETPHGEPPPGAFEKIELGDFGGCAVAMDGHVECWGWTSMGDYFTAPEGTFLDIARYAGGHGFCGLRDDSTIDCWGQEEGEYTGVYVLESPSGTWSLVGEGGNSGGCGIRTSGEVACWPEGVADGYPAVQGAFTQLTASHDVVCGLSGDGHTSCWGPDSLNEDSVMDVPGVEFTMIAGGYSHACGLTRDGEARCWGNNGYGQLDAPEALP